MNYKKKKKLVGGLKIIYFTIFFVLFFCKPLSASQIYDYQTDKLINILNNQILSVNEYDKKIKFKIINDNFPNAFVVEDNTIYISSGLIIHSPDYVSLLAVLAHEIGHIEKYHVAKRKKEINNLGKLNSVGNIAAIVGSMIMKEPELINTLVINQTTINNFYISFSQEQEREADSYAIKTLEKLKLPKDSLKKFLYILENKTQFNIMDDELKKFSTHPIFEERYEIINENNNNHNKIDTNIQKEFSFIKAKFLAYTNNEYSINLKGDQKIYYEAIRNSLSGKLFESLEKLNSLILKNDNLFLIETKADILLSYGYNKEAIEFYKKVLIHDRENDYVKFNLFINLNIIDKKPIYIREVFIKNQNLIKLFPNNQTLLLKYHNLAKILKYNDWIEFFDILLFKKNESENYLLNLNEKTKDNNLKKLIKLYI